MDRFNRDRCPRLSAGLSKAPCATRRRAISLISNVRRGRKLSRLLRRTAYRRGLRYGVAAAIEHESVIRMLKIGTLIDVGANVGQFTLLCKTLHPNVHVHAFEPLSAMADRFASLFADDGTITLHRMAAGERADRAQINVSGRPDSSSLLPIAALQDELFPGTATASTETVRVVRVDDVLAPADLAGPTLVKLDVQGFELAALKGMPRLLAAADYAYVEVSYKELYEGQPLASEIVSWLAVQNYQLAGTFNPSMLPSGEAVQADMLFVRNGAPTNA